MPSVRSILLLIVLTYPFQQASAAAIECNKVHTRVEKLICGDTDLLEQDKRLANYFRKLLSSVTDTAEVRKLQKQWIRSIRDRCADTECLSQAYTLQQQKLLESGIPEDTDPSNPEEACIKAGMPPGGADCMGYIGAQGREQQEIRIKKLVETLGSATLVSPEIANQLLTYHQRWNTLRDEHCEKYGEANQGAPQWNAVKEFECRDTMAVQHLEQLSHLLACVQQGQTCQVPSSILLPETDF